MNLNARCPILLVEDDFVLRAGLAEFLAGQGYDVECAANGLEAYHCLNRASTKPAVIVLDMMMPYMDARQFRDLQRALPGAADLPIIVITGSRERAAEIVQLEAKQVFFKPLDTSRLLHAISELASAATA